MPHANYRAADGLNDVPVSDATPFPVKTSAGVDSTGTALPTNFDSLGSTFTRNASGSIATEARTDGTNTWTQTYTRDGSDNITTISKWVKS